MESSLGTETMEQYQRETELLQSYRNRLQSFYDNDPTLQENAFDHYGSAEEYRHEVEQQTKQLLNLGVVMLVVIVCLALVSLLIYLVFTYKQPTELDDEAENKSIIELRRRRQTIANRIGQDIDLPSPSIPHEHWQVDVENLKPRDLGTPRQRDSPLAGNVVDF